MDYRLINVGFGNFVAAERILYVVTMDSKPAKEAFSELRRGTRSTDFTKGRKVRSLIYLDSLGESGMGKIVASTMLPKTIANRIADKSAASSAGKKDA